MSLLWRKSEAQRRLYGKDKISNAKNNYSDCCDSSIVKFYAVDELLNDPLHKTKTKPMNNKAFTLLELLMVVIIIGILATFAMPEYAKFKEKAYAAEAVNVLSAIKDAQFRYKMETGSYANGDILLDIEIEDSKYWRYRIFDASDSSFIVLATRRKGTPVFDEFGGVSPHWQTITLNWDDNTGVTWYGDHPGVPKN